VDQRSVQPGRTSGKESVERQLVEEKVEKVQQPASEPVIQEQPETGYTESQNSKGPQVQGG